MYTEKKMFVKRLVREAVYKMGIERVSKILDVAPKTIYRWMNGENRMTAVDFFVVCELIGVDFARNGEYIRRADSSGLDAPGSSPEPLLWLFSLQKRSGNYDRVR